MKKLGLIFMLLLAAFLIAACTSGEKTTTQQSEIKEQPANGSNGRYLVLYCSRTSNTERVAQQIGEALDCDIIEVEPETPYDTDYDAMLERSQAELAAIRRGEYPPVKTSVEQFDGYDAVFVGYPIWYDSMATPMQTFLHTHAEKLSGTRIVLFVTSGSGGVSNSVSEAKNLCPDAIITDSVLHFTSSTLVQMDSCVASWLVQIGINE